MASAMERRLAEMLVRDNVITQDELEHALELQEKQGGSLGSILIDNKYANEWEIAAAIGKQLNVPFITLSHYEIDPSILKSIPEDLVRKYQIVPIDKTGDTLTVALSDPSNIYLLDELRLLTNCKIVPVISFESDIKEAIERYYPKSESALDEMLKEISDEETAVLEALESGMTEPAEAELDEGEVEATDAPVIQLVNLIVHDAIRMRASDIHIEPYEKELRLRYRIDGVLHEMKAPPKKFQNAIVSRIKIMSDLDIAERRLPQDGRFKVTVQGRSIDFRVSTCPTVFGEKVVIRILDRGNLMLNLTDLGMDPEVLAGFEAQIRAPWGMILVTGPTGSGKSTTLYSALNTINDPRKNIMTIEDPVEYQLRGINQVQVHPEIGLTFAEGLRSFLRQDPDIIMVGEIRDKETAEIAVKAALTGHLVLSTLHTNDAPSTINRLTNMGVEAFLVTASVNLIVAQRLVRRICENCKQFYDPPAELLRSLQIPEDAKFARGAGCDRCLNSGYKGRVALYELLHLSDAMRDKIIEGISTTQLKRMAIQEGMITLRRAGLQKVAQGVTTIDEVLSVTAPDER
ncbi:MAG: type IV-A pilus assembly ATPase PilB [Candidatus Sumerlaea sp.]|jgi:type IV pilus assembly protein PilB|nr:MAG: type IV-A pilus assembly ATPase PilB [Candidatus Sumerlaea sp.]